MVESAGQGKKMSLEDLEQQTELTLEHLISAHSKNDAAYANDCRYMLGKLQMEGTFPENVPLNM